MAKAVSLICITFGTASRVEANMLSGPKLQTITETTYMFSDKTTITLFRYLHFSFSVHGVSNTVAINKKKLTLVSLRKKPIINCGMRVIFK